MYNILPSFSCIYFQKEGAKKGRKKKCATASIKNSPVSLRDGDTLGVKVSTYNAHSRPAGLCDGEWAGGVPSMCIETTPMQVLQ